MCREQIVVNGKISVQLEPIVLACLSLFSSTNSFYEAEVHIIYHTIKSFSSAFCRKSLEMINVRLRALGLLIHVNSKEICSCSTNYMGLFERHAKESLQPCFCIRKDY